jgi:hypothetical protein
LKIFLAMFLLANAATSFSKEESLSKRNRYFPNSLGRSIVIEKKWNPITETIEISSNESFVQSGFDLVKLENAEFDLEKRIRGALDEKLIEILKTKNDEAKLLVIVTMKPKQGIKYLDKEKTQIEEQRQSSIAINLLEPPVSFGKFFSEKQVNKEVFSSFSGRIELSKKEIMGVMHSQEIASIAMYEPQETVVSPAAMIFPAFFGQSTLDLNTLAKSAYDHSQIILPPNLASNVNVATFESGLDSRFLSYLQKPPIVWEAMTVPFISPEGDIFTRVTDSIHTLTTFTNLINAAPAARHFHRRSWTYNTTADADFLINNQIHSVSLSITNSNNVHDAQNISVDDFAARFPYPVFSVPTSNKNWDSVSHWRCYNAISVGNVQDSAGLHFKIDTLTCGGGATRTINPIPIYGGCINGGSNTNSCQSDREMPTIVAPGYTPFANHSLPPYTPTNPCQMLNLTEMIGPGIATGQRWGTSMSAPTTNGMVGNLIGQASGLAYKPEAVRAIMILTARNVTNGYWNHGYDGKDGGGVIHGADAISFGKSYTQVYPGSPSAEKALWYGSFSAGDFSPTRNKTFSIKIPSTKPAGKHLRIVLTWNSIPDLVARRNYLSDIDLRFTSNSGVTTSTSWDSNNEVLDIESSTLTAGGTYQCVVVPAIWRIGTNARTSSTYASLAWHWVTDRAR